jgi:hypothetical protein
MVTPRRQALWMDFSLGGGAMLFGVLARGTPTTLDGLLIAGTGLFAFLTTLYVAEQTRVLALVNRTRPMSLILAAAMFTAVGVALIVGQGVVATPSATLLFGMGVGFVVYRVRFGLTGPLPERRLEQAKLWGSPPKRRP